MLPPQAIEAEEAVLGAIMIDSKAHLKVAEKFRPEIFYLEKHKLIAKTIQDLIRSGSAIDILTVSERLKAEKKLGEAGGRMYIVKLTNGIASSSHIENHIDIVCERFIAREAASLCMDIGRKAMREDEDTAMLVNELEYRTAQLQRVMLTGNVRTLSGILNDVWSNDSSKTYVKSKHSAINSNFGGWSKGTLNIIAGRPGMGKSAFHVSEALSCASRGYSVMSFNLEMMETQFVPRMECNMSGIGNKQYKERRFSPSEYERLQSVRKILLSMEDRLHLDFTGGISVFDITAKAKKVKMDMGGLDIIFVDHIQFVTVPDAMRKGMTRDAEIGIITRELKRFAKNENVAVIAFSHLSRRTEESKTKRPTLADLRESGNIENDADTISFLLRPEYYFEKDHTGSIIYDTPEKLDYKGICQFICDKNRDGSTFEDDFKVNLSTSCFMDLERKGQDESDENVF